MKTLRIIPFIALFAFVACSSNKQMAKDDVYYSPYGNQGGRMTTGNGSYVSPSISSNSEYDYQAYYPCDAGKNIAHNNAHSRNCKPKSQKTSCFSPKTNLFRWPPYTTTSARHPKSQVYRMGKHHWFLDSHNLYRWNSCHLKWRNGFPWVCQASHKLTSRQTKQIV